MTWRDGTHQCSTALAQHSSVRLNAWRKASRSLGFLVRFTRFHHRLWVEFSVLKTLRSGKFSNMKLWTGAQILMFEICLIWGF